MEKPDKSRVSIANYVASGLVFGAVISVAVLARWEGSGMRPIRYFVDERNLGRLILALMIVASAVFVLHHVQRIWEVDKGWSPNAVAGAAVVAALMYGLYRLMGHFTL
jgi:hypothetical protein